MALFVISRKNLMDEPYPGQDPAIAVAAINPKQDAIRIKRPRAPVAKLDAERLLGTSGFDKLLEMLKTTKRTNDPAQDLHRIMLLYQIWGQELFPKLTLVDFIQKTQRVCTQRPLRMYLKEIIAMEKRRKMGSFAEESMYANPWAGSDSEDDVVISRVPNDEDDENINPHRLDLFASVPSSDYLPVW